MNLDLYHAQIMDGDLTRLIDGGKALMPLGDYGFSRRIGWVNDATASHGS